MRNDREYEDRFSEIFKEAVDNSEETPDFYSDMTMSRLKPLEELNCEIKHKKKFFRITSVRVAALVLAFLVSSSALAVFMTENNVVEAAKTKVADIRWSMDKDVAKVTEDNGMGEVKEALVMSISDWKDIDKAKKFLPELYVPEYITEGYEFFSLKIRKFNQINYNVEYIYKNSSEQFLDITQSNANNKTYVDNADDMIKCNKGDCYLTFFDEIGMITGSLVFDCDTFTVSIFDDSGEIVRIIEGLE